MIHAFNVDISDISVLPDNLKFDKKRICKFLQEKIPDVFLNTPNSIKAENIITDISETNSPWLYFEINVANALLPEKAIIESHENFSYMPEMTFEADLKRFEKVNVEAFLLQCGFKKTEDWNCENACFEEKFR